MSNAWAGRGARGGGGPRGGRGGANGGGPRPPQPNNGGGPYPPLRPQHHSQGMASVTQNMANMNVSQQQRQQQPQRGGGGQHEGMSSRGRPHREEGASGYSEGNRDQGSSSRSGGNGRSRGAAQGSEGPKKRGRRENNFDLVLSRNAVCGPDRPSKRGAGGEKIQLVANLFPLNKKPDWTLYNYRVDFKNAREGGEEEQRTFVKKGLLAEQKNYLGMHIFDGSNLYTIARLTPEPLILTSLRRNDNTPFELTITLVGQLHPTDVAYLQFFNIIMRKCLSLLNFTLIGRHFYDPEAEINLAQIGYVLIPGFITNIRQYEERLMMCVEITHKVLREGSCLQLRRQCRNNNEYRDMLVGSVVMTRYNNRTYRVDDIAWDQNPSTTFESNGTRVSLAEYYNRKYQLRVNDMSQPLLVSRPRARDLHRGDNQTILLIPEFCHPTGIPDQDRQNYTKMNALSTYLQQDPSRRAASTIGFMRRLRTSDTTRTHLTSWELGFEGMDLVNIQEGRVLPRETLFFRDPKTPFKVPANADWTSELRTGSANKMAAAQEFRNWVLITPAQVNTNDLLSIMIKVGNGMGFPVSNPLHIERIQDTRVHGYLTALESVKNNFKTANLIFTVMPQAKDTSAIYNEVKKRCLTVYGIHNQCFQAKHLSPNNSGRLMSVVTKLLVQINAKLGGEPWKINLNFKVPTMIVGFDVYHPGKGRDAGRKSYGAIVATTNRCASKFYSTVTPHEGMQEISNALELDILKCVKAFQKANSGVVPQYIILYRDGVGEGQLGYVYETEVGQIQRALKSYYDTLGKMAPKLLFVVVTKKGNARIMTRHNQNYDNPPPGTIVDNTITLPERYDFFLVAQQARRGQTVSPTTFNVLHDDVKITPAELQALTFQQCHMYFNWSGTVAVPAVCQYAHKLAYLTGTGLDTAAGAGQAPLVQEHLLSYLYFL